jgi:hypothetical protein
MADTRSNDTFTAFAARLRAEGFTVSDTAAQEMWAALPGLEALRQRVRRTYRPSDEPAHVFHPARQGEPTERSS